MVADKENPAAWSDAIRVNVTLPAGNDDLTIDTPLVTDLQVQRIIQNYALSTPLAIAIAELAFSTGRTR